MKIGNFRASNEPIGGVAMKVESMMLFSLALVTMAVPTFTFAPIEAQSQSQGKTASKAPSEKKLSGCICGFDEAKSIVTVVPWDEDRKLWDSGNAKVFTYTEKTVIEGESKATVAELKNGKVVKSFHLTGVSTSGLSGTPFEIRGLSQCINRRTTLHWSEGKAVAVASRLELPYLFAGESMPAMVGNQGARAVGSDDCPCRLK